MRVGALLLSLASLTVACSRGSEPMPTRLRELESPARPGSGEPNLTVAPDGRVLLSWIEPAGEKRHVLRYATRAKGGGWSEARTIAEGSDWFVNWADFPAVAALPDGTLFAHWLAKSGASPYAYNVNVSVSRDGGAGWSAAVVPHRDDTQTEHGFVSLTPWSREAMGAIWLDGRKTAGAGHDAHASGQGAMGLVHTTIGSDGTLGPETVLDNRVCDCCQTDAALADGATVVVYRDRSEKEVRDVSVVRFVDGRWSAPRTLAEDRWEINGCPVNGPAVASDGRRVAVAWFTAPADTSRVKVAFSEDAGATFGRPIVVDDGRPLGRVDVVVLGDGGAVVSWMEQVEKGAALRVNRVGVDGARGESLTVADSTSARSSGFPRMVASGGEITIAWRDPGIPPKVRTTTLTP
jgi:hypothetical protein